MPVHLSVICRCFCATVAELGSGNRDRVAPQILKYLLSWPVQKKLAFYGKNFCIHLIFLSFKKNKKMKMVLNEHVIFYIEMTNGF